MPQEFDITFFLQIFARIPINHNMEASETLDF